MCWNPPSKQLNNGTQPSEKGLPFPTHLNLSDDVPFMFILRGQTLVNPWALSNSKWPSWETGLIISAWEPTGTWRAAAGALIYLLTPELMRDQAGHGPGEADWTGRKKEARQRNVATAQKKKEELGGWVAAERRRGWASPWSNNPLVMERASGGCSILVKPLTFNSHLSSNMFHMCVPVALQGDEIDPLRSVL